MPATRLLALTPVVFRDLAAHDFAIERESLQDDVESAAVLVRKHKTEIEPIIVLALAVDDRVGAMRGCAGLSAVRHDGPHSSGCDVLREQAPRASWRLPARVRSSMEAGYLNGTLPQDGVKQRPTKPG